MARLYGGQRRCQLCSIALYFGVPGATRRRDSTETRRPEHSTVVLALVRERVMGGTENDQTVPLGHGARARHRRHRERSDRAARPWIGFARTELGVVAVRTYGFGHFW
ncbi:hypothetical protein GCM10022226_37840 [Sphaerisporangium flaviroseum]|uniref:Uncharacterized protein n=1 Tax=Sphaerisporangium flaviroseum TaxID=509199 RepID=A0ABP7IAG4_9ACTN